MFLVLFPASTLIIALVLDVVFGDPPNRVHPVVWMGSYIALLWRRRPQGAGAKSARPRGADAGEDRPVPGRRGGAGANAAREAQLLYGTVVVLSGLVLFTAPWTVLLAISLPLYWLWSAPALKTTFAMRSLLRAVARVRTALEAGDVGAARELAARHLVSRDTSRLSPPLVAAAAIESLAENVTDGLTAPLLYFSLLGLPGAWGYRFCNTCDSMLGYRDAEHEWGGKFAARLDDLLGWIPARLTGGLIVVAALLTGEDAAGAWRTMLGQHGRTASPNAGWTMAAMAGALSVTLEKVGVYRLEGGEAPLNAGTLRRAERVARGAFLLVSAGAALLLVVLTGLLGRGYVEALFI